MIFLIIPLSAMLIALGVLVPNVSAVAVAALFVILEVILVARDLLLFRSIIEASQEEQVPAAVSWWTGVGAQLGEQAARIVEHFEEREFTGWLADEVHGDPALDPLFQEIVAKERLRGNGEVDLFQRVLSYGSRRLRASVGVIATADETGVRLVGTGTPGRRFEETLRASAAAYFQGVDRSILGLRDGFESQTPLGEFSAFGCRYTVCEAFSWNGVGGVRSGLLWFGYPDSRTPLAIERGLIEKLARRLEQELEFHSRAQELLAEGKRGLSIVGKDDVLAQVSHDIRSPLNNVRAVLSLLRFENMRDESAELLDVALQNCDSVGELVSDVLDLSAANQEKSAARASLPITQLVRQVVESFTASAKQKGIEIVAEYPRDELFILANRVEMKRSITNILSNALKYTPHGTIFVSLNRVGSAVEVSVKDTGLGMSPEQLEKLFSPFMRFHQDAAEGIGLGLSLTKTFVERNEGKISVRSAVGRGTQFLLSFPLSEESRELQQDKPTIRTLHQNFVSNERKQSVLVVDDDSDCVLTLARALEQAGFTVLKAYSTTEANQILNFEQVDVIVSDGQMPDGSAKNILAFTQERKMNTPFIVATGDRRLGTSFLGLGVDAVVEKPYDLSQLVELVCSCVSERDQNRRWAIGAE